MVKRSKITRYGSSVLDEEVGTIIKDAPVVVALGYPAPYSVGASSLGAQSVYRIWNSVSGLACSRFFMPSSKEEMPRPLTSVENGRPVADSAAIAFSVACETELLGVVALLEAAGLEPLASHRDEADPPVIIGGPITFLDPSLVAPLADIVGVGESEETLVVLGGALVSTGNKSELIDAADGAAPGIWIPARQPIHPPLTPAPIELLPARAALWSPHAELKDLFLIEATRGCKRGCAFCVLSCKTHGQAKFRAIEIQKLLDAIPDNAPGVGLVGAAVTDHPQIESLVESIVDTGKRVSLSSIRADRLTHELATQLKRGGLRSLTVAADGCSDAIRRSIHKGITTDHLLEAASIARSIGLKGIKVYTMLGLPNETDEDVVVFCDLMMKMGRSLRVSVAAQAFVPKPGTPLCDAPMLDETTVRKRLALIRKQTKGRIKLLPTSPRWSWLDWKLAHAGEKAALVAIEAHSGGGSFSAWRKALAGYDL